jgi:transcriptional regulator with XRE-family HTH domain
MLLRDALGETLRDARTRQNRTLRDVSTAANVSLGYLSEVERGRKEASSELLASICDALDVRLADVLDEASITLRSTVIAAAPGKADRVAVTANSAKAGLDARAADGNLRIVLPYSMTRSAPSVA